jgi:hypothetical protein
LLDNKDDEGNELEVVLMQMETVKKIYQDLKAYNNNFEYREMIIDKSIAVKIMLYPKYMIINKTGYDIFYHADK